MQIPVATHVGEEASPSPTPWVLNYRETDPAVLPVATKPGRSSLA